MREMEDRIIIDDEAVEARLREKAEARMRDFARLRLGEVTAEELQEENSGRRGRLFCSSGSSGPIH